MKTFHSLAGVTLLCLLASACSTDHIAPAPDQKEQYVREFVSTFGVPDPDHNYAMAQSAGLHVTTKKGGHVSVIAEVAGAEYLFADLDVAPGTHALPVTIPASVKELKVVTGLGVHVVPTTATVDIDKAPAGSRAGSFILEDESNDGMMIFTDTEEGNWPYLAFSPSEFLNTYFERHPEGQTNYKNDGQLKNGGRKYPIYVKEGQYAGKSVLLPIWERAEHETIFGCANSSTGYTYYIFPIYWQTDRHGHKDYKTILHKVREGVAGLYSPFEAPFGSTDANIPFPHLGYSTTVSSRQEIDMTDLSKQFTFDDGSFSRAYDPSEVSMVISRGFKVKLNAPSDLSNSFRPKFAIAVESGFNGDGSFSSFSSSAPFYNSLFWGTNYYDVPLNTLYFALSASRAEAMMNVSDYKDPYIYVNDGKDYPEYMEGGSKYNKWALVKDDGNGFYGRNSGYTRILGFNSAASKEADTAPRDFRDVIFLVVPHIENSMHWYNQYAELPPAYEWTIAAEDLGGSFDWDFNDAVFSFTDVIRNLKTEHLLDGVSMVSGPQNAQAMRIITVTPKAAGGTMPIYITYTGKIKPYPDWMETPDEKAARLYEFCGRWISMDPYNAVKRAFIYGDKMFSEADAELKAYLNADTREGTYILGCELHKWLGADTHEKQYNVGASRAALTPKSVQFVIPTNLDVADEDLLGYKEGLLAAASDNQPLFGFSVLVDKENTLNIDTFNDTDNGFRHIEGLSLGEGTYIVGAPSDNKELTAPQLILVEGDWQWPTELTNIKDAYPQFAAWIQNKEGAPEWHNNPASGKVTKK